MTITIPKKSLALTTHAPALVRAIIPAKKALIITGKAPTKRFAKNVQWWPKVRF
jgi:hypothetical protein